VNKHDEINITLFVIPGLTRNPVFFWILAQASPRRAFAGMTSLAGIDVAEYNTISKKGWKE
jgi:hypothetical protein